MSAMKSVLEAYRSNRYEFALLDVAVLRQAAANRGKSHFEAALSSIRQVAPAAEIIVLCPQEMVTEGVLAVRAGARAYLTYPLREDEVRFAAESLYESVRMESEIDYLRDESWRGDSIEDIRSNAPAMQEAIRKAHSVAPTRSTVLLTGETGTGKGVLARLIHLCSNRRDAQFINVHCGAIPDTLIESELFGHERGAFTGATRRKPGKFEIAHGGTIFLDEIGTITPAVQIKLLSVLQERTIQRLGGDKDIDVDVRIIAATNVDLKQMVAQGRFRSDLYYRLSVFPIEIPPLRERAEDIPGLVRFFLREARRLHRKDIRAVEPSVLDALKRYEWPGNIRELENLLERACILETSSILSPESFPTELFTEVLLETADLADGSLTLAEVRRLSLERAEQQYLKALLERHSGRIGEAARSAGIGPRQMHKLLTKYAIRKEDYKKTKLWS
jgi:DNA-binding NtrC family response regulator